MYYFGGKKSYLSVHTCVHFRFLNIFLSWFIWREIVRRCFQLPGGENAGRANSLFRPYYPNINNL